MPVITDDIAMLETAAEHYATSGGGLTKSHPGRYVSSLGPVYAKVTTLRLARGSFENSGSPVDMTIRCELAEETLSVIFHGVDAPSFNHGTYVEPVHPLDNPEGPSRLATCALAHQSVTFSQSSSLGFARTTRPLAVWGRGSSFSRLTRQRRTPA